MPTPFTHLAKAQHLIDDPILSSEHRTLLAEYWGAFLLGNIIPDAHKEVDSLKRQDTHFFDYNPTIDPPAEQVMLKSFPRLTATHLGKTAHAAFIAGYLAHLVVDEVWCEDIIFPYFHQVEWADTHTRHFMFIVLLTIMDGRDYDCLSKEMYYDLELVQPYQWLPFLPDRAIIAWRDRIAVQLEPDGERETLQILGEIVKPGYDGLVEILNSPDRLQSELWDRLPQTKVAESEEKAYQRMAGVVRDYLNGQLFE